MMEKATLTWNYQSPPSPSFSSSSSSRKMNFNFNSFNGNNKNNSSSKPSCLLSTLADIEERMKMLAVNNPKEEYEGDTFAERAESYYRKRPQLIALLQDLYNAYLTLFDKYSQPSSNPNLNNYKSQHHHHRHSSKVSDYYYDTVTDIDSDLESSLSYQQPILTRVNNNNDHDQNPNYDIVAELVMKNVELDVVMEELGRSERRCSESLRKIELQRCLLEVLESERLVLLNENARLEYRAGALAEENRRLVSESIFMQQKARELARCVLKMREDQRVCMLSRKIKDLQGQIHGLEKRNKDYYDQLVSRTTSTSSEKGDNRQDFKKTKKKNEVAFEGCFQMKNQLNQMRLMLTRSQSGSAFHIGMKKASFNLWERVKSMDKFLCGANPASA